jgi:hypothetical protein
VIWVSYLWTFNKPYRLYWNICQTSWMNKTSCWLIVQIRMTFYLFRSHAWNPYWPLSVPFPISPLQFYIIFLPLFYPRSWNTWTPLLSPSSVSQLSWEASPSVFLKHAPQIWGRSLTRSSVLYTWLHRPLMKSCLVWSLAFKS